MEKIKVGISVGDINGIGLEVILKTLADRRVAEMFTPVIYGSSKVVAYHKNIVGLNEMSFSGIAPGNDFKHDRINVVNCWEDEVKIELGNITEAGGKYAYIALDKATNDLKSGAIDALVTAPIHKKAMQMANFPHLGHTEFLTKAYGVKESLMLMVNGDMRVGLVTNHVPIKDVAGMITRERLKNKLALFNKSLKVDFGIERPVIAVLGLNPHAGDGGVIGKEEEEVIQPLIIEAKKRGLAVMGPFPADGFFGSGQYKKFDGILAMYHDQGLIPFKALSFGDGVNFTAGIDGVRTSPDHGTAYDIAGKNLAHPDSFRKAVFLAMDVARHRKSYQEMHANPVKKHKHQSEDKKKKDGKGNYKNKQNN